MDLGPVMWSAEAEAWRKEFWRWAQERIASRASEFESNEAVPDSVIAELAATGWLGALVPSEYGGLGLGYLEFGFLNEALGAACSSVRTLLTVHSMVCQALTRWGTAPQKQLWLPQLAQGSMIGAFALTEPETGSNARGITTVAEGVPGGWRLNGTKKWISFAQRADCFLVLAALKSETVVPDKRPAIALLVDGRSAGLTRHPLTGLLGTKASRLAELHFDDCFVPAENALSRPGFGLAICSAALEIGRLSVAWGGVGLAQACLEASSAYAAKRQQFGVPIASHQLIQAKLTDMMVNTRAARNLCVQASLSRQSQRPNSVLDTLMAKYYAARVAQMASQEAVQIHGANGCSDDYPVARYYRDAKTLEIIEGTSEVLQGLIAQQVRMELMQYR